MLSTINAIDMLSQSFLRCVSKYWRGIAVPSSLHPYPTSPSSTLDAQDPLQDYRIGINYPAAKYNYFLMLSSLLLSTTPLWPEILQDKPVFPTQMGLHIAPRCSPRNALVWTETFEFSWVSGTNLFRLIEVFWIPKQQWRLCRHCGPLRDVVASNYRILTTLSP